MGCCQNSQNYEGQMNFDPNLEDNELLNNNRNLDQELEQEQMDGETDVPENSNNGKNKKTRFKGSNIEIDDEMKDFDKIQKNQQNRIQQNKNKFANSFNNNDDGETKIQDDQISTASYKKTLERLTNQYSQPDMCISPRSLMFQNNHEIRVAYIIENSNYSSQQYYPNSTKNGNNKETNRRNSENNNNKSNIQSPYGNGLNKDNNMDKENEDIMFNSQNPHFSSLNNNNISNNNNINLFDTNINSNNINKQKENASEFYMSETEAMQNNDKNFTGISSARNQINLEYLQEKSKQFSVKYNREFNSSSSNSNQSNSSKQSKQQQQQGKQVQEFSNFLSQFGFEIHCYNNVEADSCDIGKLGIKQIVNQILFKTVQAQICKQNITVFFIYVGCTIEQESQKEQYILTQDMNAYNLSFLKDIAGSYSKCKVLGLIDSQIIKVSDILSKKIEYQMPISQRNNFIQMIFIIQSAFKQNINEKQAKATKIQEGFEQKYQNILQLFQKAVSENKSLKLSDIVMILKSNTSCYFDFIGGYSDFRFDNIQNQNYEIVSPQSFSQQQLFLQSELMIQIQTDNQELLRVQKQQETKLNRLEKQIEKQTENIELQGENVNKELTDIKKIQKQLLEQDKQNKDSKIIQLTMKEIEAGFTGQGELTLADGTYRGQFYKGMKQGKGVFQWTSNDVYEGDWVEDKRTGHGKLVWGISKNTYEGDFKQNFEHGKGKFTWFESGNVYDGDFVKNEQTGKGKFIWKTSQQVYDGEFYKGCFQGFGKLYKQDGTILYEGEWKNDKMVT